MDHSTPNRTQNPQYVQLKIIPLIIHPDSLFSNDSLTSLPSSTSPLSGPSRPHRLLVFINPFGGKKRGKQIFHSLVAPLFELAGISSHVVGEILRLSVPFNNWTVIKCPLVCSLIRPARQVVRFSSDIGRSLSRPGKRAKLSSKVK